MPFVAVIFVHIVMEQLLPLVPSTELNVDILCLSSGDINSNSSIDEDTSLCLSLDRSSVDEDEISWKIKGRAGAGTTSYPPGGVRWWMGPVGCHGEGLLYFNFKSGLSVE